MHSGSSIQGGSDRDIAAVTWKSVFGVELCGGLIIGSRWIGCRGSCGSGRFGCFLIFTGSKEPKPQDGSTKN